MASLQPRSSYCITTGPVAKAKSGLHKLHCQSHAGWPCRSTSCWRCCSRAAPTALTKAPTSSPNEVDHRQPTSTLSDTQLPLQEYFLMALSQPRSTYRIDEGPNAKAKPSQVL